MAEDAGKTDPQEGEQSSDPASNAAADASDSSSDKSAALQQSKIEALLNEVPGQSAPDNEPTAAATAPAVAVEPEVAVQPSIPANSTASSTIQQEDVEFLLNQAEQAISSINDPPSELPPGISKFEFEDLARGAVSSEVASVELMRDVQLDLHIELGRTHMYLEDILKLTKGAVVPLDKLAGDPVDIFANGRLIARGEVLVLNDSFCIRVAELIVGDDADV